MSDGTPSDITCAKIRLAGTSNRGRQECLPHRSSAVTAESMRLETPVPRYDSLLKCESTPFCFNSFSCQPSCQRLGCWPTRHPARDASDNVAWPAGTSLSEDQRLDLLRKDLLATMAAFDRSLEKPNPEPE